MIFAYEINFHSGITQIIDARLLTEDFDRIVEENRTSTDFFHVGRGNYLHKLRPADVESYRVGEYNITGATENELHFAGQEEPTA